VVWHLEDLVASGTDPVAVMQAGGWKDQNPTFSGAGPGRRGARRAGRKAPSGTKGRCGAAALRDSHDDRFGDHATAPEV
jgi:hypothetical protein